MLKMATISLPVTSPSSGTDLLLCNADGVFLDGVTICSGTARGLDPAHQPLLALIQA